MNGLVVDLFAGGGGASTGLEAALGRPIDIAINHDQVALDAHRANHPRTRHIATNVWDVKPREATGGRPVDVLWASPDCTHFSVAKGGKPRKQGIRSLAWVVVKWAVEVQPAVIFLENVTEFRGWGPLGPDNRPDKARMGETFRRWKRQLERLGYSVDFRILDASHYGAPTKRKRLFLVARRDGEKIRWPMQTHGGLGLKPLRTAAECIDWSLECPSIFERKKPLAEKTLRRVAEGIRRFVLNNPRPFIMVMNHSNPPMEVEQPLGTVTTQDNRFNLVAPVLAGVGGPAGQGAPAPVSGPMGTVLAESHRALVTPVVVGVGGRAGQSQATSGDAPLGTVTAKNDRAVIAPSLIKVNHGRDLARSNSVEEPLTTVTATQRGHAVVAPVLATIDHQSKGARASTQATDPLGTITSKARDVLIAPTMVQLGYGEREGQAPRALDLHSPLGTVVAQGLKHGLVSAFLASNFGGEVGITARDHHSLVTGHLATFRGTSDAHPGAAPVDEPLPTISAQGTHVAEVRAFLMAYYGSGGQWSSLGEPARTITAKHRLGLVTVAGVDYQIVDIGLRMLEPDELLRAQFGRFAKGYDLSAAKTKSAKVRLIGNSVCPEAAEALVAANLPRRARRAA